MYKSVIRAQMRKRESARWAGERLEAKRGLVVEFPTSETLHNLRERMVEQPYPSICRAGHGVHHRVIYPSLLVEAGRVCCLEIKYMRRKNCIM
jgi:hypothetical protein